AHRLRLRCCAGSGAVARPRPHRDLPSFPTRRSSDLGGLLGGGHERSVRRAAGGELARALVRGVGAPQVQARPAEPAPLAGTSARSEEHTAELQSRFELVCRLLPAKKNATPVKPIPAT